MCSASGAIGVFDSGVGGLTVVRAIAARLPREDIVYLGDTARVPYGTKSPATVIRYARACAGMLVKRGVKLLVVACNTASSCAIETLREDLDIPVLGVIEPGARAAVRGTRNGRVGVIGTAATVASKAYPEAIARIALAIEVYCAPCPLFVPLAEEGWTTGGVPRAVAERYLGELRGHGVDTLVLGCTHYPLLADVIAETMGEAVTLVDSAEETALAVEETLAESGLQNTASAAPARQFMVSDDPNSFARIGRRFLGGGLGEIEWVDF